MTDDAVTVKATADHLHKGRQVKPGETYEVCEADARDLVALGYAVRIVRPVPGATQAPGKYSTRVVHPKDSG